MPKAFSGPLNEYLPRLSLDREALVAALRKDWTRHSELSRLRTEQEVEKLWLLFQHYGIHPDSPQAELGLALALARDFVPGFQEPPHIDRPGAKTKWTFSLLMALHAEVEALLAEPGKTQREVFKSLANVNPWKKILRTNDGHRDPDPAHALAKQYRRAKNELKALERQYHERRSSRAYAGSPRTRKKT